jgi:hypothetical protein
MPLEYENKTWRTEGSEYIGCLLQRSVMGVEGGWKEQTQAKVVGWLSASESDFEDIRGNPAPLYRIKYLDGALQGDEEDLEEYEVRNSVHRVPTKWKKGDCASKKKRKAATPAPAPTTTTMTTTASTTDKTRACKKKKQDERNPASKIPDLLQELFDGGDLCLLTKDEGRSQEHDKRMATIGEVWKKLNVKQNGESMEAMEKLGYVKEKVSGAFNGSFLKEKNTGKFIHFNNIPSNALKKETPPAAEEANYVPGGIEIQGNLEEERLKSGCLDSNIANLMQYEKKLGFGYTT